MSLNNNIQRPTTISEAISQVSYTHFITLAPSRIIEDGKSFKPSKIDMPKIERVVDILGSRISKFSRNTCEKHGRRYVGNDLIGIPEFKSKQGNRIVPLHIHIMVRIDMNFELEIIDHINIKVPILTRKILGFPCKPHIEQVYGILGCANYMTKNYNHHSNDYGFVYLTYR